VYRYYSNHTVLYIGEVLARDSPAKTSFVKEKKLNVHKFDSATLFKVPIGSIFTNITHLSTLYDLSYVIDIPVKNVD
jgi:hypothetical protein